MSNFLLALLSVLSFQTLAQSSDLPWWGVSDREIESAHCKTRSVPSLESLERYINSTKVGEIRNVNIFGADIADTDNMIKALQDLTTRTPMYGGTWQKPKESQVNLQNEFNINPDCNKVLCAVQKIWGDELGVKILWIYLKHGFNASELAFDLSARFALDEIDDVIMTLEDLPDHLIPLGFEKNQRLSPIALGQQSHAVANSTIILMNSWRQKSSMTKQQTLFHELGHNMSYRFLSKTDLAEWKQISGWDDPSKECFVSRYSQETPGEDFAESIVAYRYKGDDFKTRCPEKYEFIKSRVIKVEYLRSNECPKS